MFPDTADHDYLVMRARTRNLTSKAATPAHGEVRLTGNPGANITGLLQLRFTGSRQRYQTTAPATIDVTGQPDLARPPAAKRYPGQSGGQYARGAADGPKPVLTATSLSPAWSAAARPNPTTPCWHVCWR
ncbi:baseplate J/gp47 family protein [Sodalis sp. (in: enterobacteria)]|uniref:baseplate J/gp47 family protein n=1 Tax=Sodalis sp. (in: enterobacteria) TaxID=1898979 RepID=UPI003F688866